MIHKEVTFIRNAHEPTCFVISEIRIQNFKSIQDLTLKPSRVTVLIGANGSGKSNILEGIAFAAGAATNRLDSVFLSSLGIRVTEDTWMQSAFPDEEDGSRAGNRPIHLTVKGNDDESTIDCRVSARFSNEDDRFLGWNVRAPILRHEIGEAILEEAVKREVAQLHETASPKNASKKAKSSDKKFDNLIRRALVRIRLDHEKRKLFPKTAEALGLDGFLIYAPENMMLRTPPAESSVLPLGVRGEGLLTLLQSFADPHLKLRSLTKRLDDLKRRLHLFGWFKDLIVPDKEATAQARLGLQDRWLAPDRAVFDQRSANEGFLFVLFYFVVMMSWRTPKFFAIDNLDNALNPKLCAELMKQIIELAVKYDKQVICTTHNPAVLEGLDLNDPNQRLFVVRRSVEGRTVLRRIHAPQPQPGEAPVPLSDAFMRGLIGGLPENF